MEAAHASNVLIRGIENEPTVRSSGEEREDEQAGEQAATLEATGIQREALATARPAQQADDNAKYAAQGY